ncbi:hypothetical protein F7725_000097 [Dissostichus mawsoni]|uniref:Uncharacterized protein n=1 Tax=Dissostichus mawsoni TaxID=36200 RepID=A0A7J5ZDC9_DISMA|nr:hypothetical protein F7725_000097 [Dissostichus mawsoni]
MPDLPAVEAMDITSYLVLHTSYYTASQMKAYKSLEAFNYFVCGWVNDLGTKEALNKCRLVFARVPVPAAMVPAPAAMVPASEPDLTAMFPAPEPAHAAMFPAPEPANTAMFPAPEPAHTAMIQASVPVPTAMVPTPEPTHTAMVPGPELAHTAMVPAPEPTHTAMVPAPEPAHTAMVQASVPVPAAMVPAPVPAMVPAQNVPSSWYGRLVTNLLLLLLLLLTDLRLKPVRLTDGLDLCSSKHSKGLGSFHPLCGDVDLREASEDTEPAVLGQLSCCGLPEDEEELRRKNREMFGQEEHQIR